MDGTGWGWGGVTWRLGWGGVCVVIKKGAVLVTEGPLTALPSQECAVVDQLYHQERKELNSIGL